MKTIKFILLGICIAAITACDLTEKPYGIYSKENMFSTEAGAQSVLLSAYRAYTPWEYVYFNFYIGDMTTDVAFNNRLDDVPYPEITEWKLNVVKDNPWIQNIFKAYYKSIHNACDILENIEAAPMTKESKDRIMGEAYFLRGFAYYHLAWTFGRVPMKLITTESFPKRAKDLDEVYNQVISDLTKASELLKINRSAGCADVVAAWSMLAKTYLTIASAKSSNVPLYKDMKFDANTCYTEAAKWAKKVVDNPAQTEYSLDPDINNVFDVTKPDGKEHIFLIAHNRDGSGTDGDYSKLPRYFLPANNGNMFYVKNSKGVYDLTVDGWSVCAPTQKLMDSYLASSPSDKRYTNLIKTEFYTKNTSGVYTAVPMTPTSQVRFNFCAKYLDPLALGTERTSCKNFMIRFADIALVYAEALGKAEGLAWLNKVSERSGGRRYMASDFANDAAFRAGVLKERGFELCFEGQRLADLRRTNNVRAIVDKKVAPSRSNLDLSVFTDEQLTFYPLPQREVDLNPNL